MKTTPEILFQNVNSWMDFESKINDFTKKEKGDAFELLTKYFFLIDPVLKSKYQQVWAFSEIPERELAFLDLPKVEIGIDIIAKADDEYHAIQCKFHTDKSRSVTFKEVSTFISLLESTSKLSQGFICAYADTTSKNYQRLKTKPLNQIMSDSWERLDKSFFDNVRSLIAGNKPVYQVFSPKEHQQKAIEEARQHFIVNKQARGKLIFPCGAGKSLTGFWIIQALQSKSTIVAVPSLALIKQTLDVYLRQITAQQSNVKWLCICSDEGIGQDQDIVYMTENLGIPCNTDSDYIEQWLIKNRDENIIIFTTYQSGVIISEISKKLQFNFDTGILDEAHKTVGSKTKLFSHLLFDENITISRRIFMTATERFFLGQKDDVVSMDDSEIYGDTFALMTFKEAIEAELLTDYQLITIDVKKSEIAAFISENNLVQLNEKWKRETESRSLASMLALRKAMKTLPIRNAVSFHGSIDKAVRSQQLQEYITNTYDYAPIDSYTVSGLMPTTRRDGIVREFASSEKALITNAKCLTEGVDVPNIDCIVFADPRSSKVDIVQALGRALRKKEGKEWGYVIVPVIYDEEKDEIDNQSFAEIMNIVQALATNDERIVEYFKRRNEKQTSKDAGEKETFKLNILSEYLDAETLATNLEIKLWERLAKLNWMLFEEARSFARGLGLKNSNEWKTYCRSDVRPKNIPAIPSQTYKNEGWISWGDWLGTRNVGPGLKKYKSFQEARKYIRSLQLKTRKDYNSFFSSNKIPSDIPLSADRFYKGNGWISWGDFLGTGIISNRLRNHREFYAAREFVRNLNLKSQAEWIAYCRSGEKPADIPSEVYRVYKGKGWVSMGDWLGTGTTAGKNIAYRNFEDARAFAQNLHLARRADWGDYCKSGSKPGDIPADPARV